MQFDVPNRVIKSEPVDNGFEVTDQSNHHDPSSVKQEAVFSHISVQQTITEEANILSPPTPPSASHLIPPSAPIATQTVLTQTVPLPTPSSSSSPLNNVAVKQEDVKSICVIETAKDGIDEDTLDERDAQIYEELLCRMRNEIAIQETIASRITVDQRIKKINVYIDPEEQINFQALFLDEAPVNNAWSSFRYPKNYEDFLETIYSWANAYLNKQEWPQKDIISMFRIIPAKLNYDPPEPYVEAEIAALLISFYERLKKDFTKINQESTVGDLATVKQVDTNDQWTEITLKLVGNDANLKFGFCCVLTVDESYVLSKRNYFGTILDSKVEMNDDDGIEFVFLTVKVFEFVPFVDDELIVHSLFRIHHIYIGGRALMVQHTVEMRCLLADPSINSAPSGIVLQLDEKKFTPFDYDAIQKAVDTVILPAECISPVCCLDFREQNKSIYDLVQIAAEVLNQIRLTPVESRWLGPCIRTFIICNNEDVLNKLYRKLVDLNFGIYRLNRKASPCNMKHRIFDIGKILVKKLCNVKDLEDLEVIEKLSEDWECAVEGFFCSPEQESKFKEILELARVFAIRNADIIMGNIFDIPNDLIFNVSNRKVPLCIMLGASTIPEFFTLPLLYYGCERFVFIDNECNTQWPTNKSLFAKLFALYEEESAQYKGAKSCVVSSVKKKIPLPEPPKESRHRQIGKNHKFNEKSRPGYNPEQRKNPRARVPYCPKPSQSQSNTNTDNTNLNNTNSNN